MAGWTRGVLVRCLLAGLGMFCESYFIFTTGQMRGIWRAAYPLCWSEGEDAACPENTSCVEVFPNAKGNDTNSEKICALGRCADATRVLLSGVEFAGIMAGMLVFGYIADRLGRRLGSAFVSVTMLVGASFMVSAAGTGESVNRLFLLFSAGFAVLGFGIGGEYPLSSVSATERAEEDVSPTLRGSYVVAVFTMQGLGAVVGSSVLLLSVKISGASVPDCGATGANAMGFLERPLFRVWRNVYLVGLVFLLFVVLYRLFFTTESAAYVSFKDTAAISLRTTISRLFRDYGLRLAGTALSWFLWDVCFYGNKLFISFLLESALSSKHTTAGRDSLGQEETYILVNNLVALTGYVLAALLIDRVGRRSMQLFGFTTIAVIFLAVAIFYSLLRRMSFGAFFALYVLTSFFGQLGPNATTYLLPAETFPTELRSTAHAISAFAGKAGALLGTTLFGLIGARSIFLACGIVSALGSLVTALLVADVTGLPLSEIDDWHKQRQLFRSGDRVRNEAVAIAASGAGKADRLSLAERWLGRGDRPLEFEMVDGQSWSSAEWEEDMQ